MSSFDTLHAFLRKTMLKVELALGQTSMRGKVSEDPIGLSELEKYLHISTYLRLVLYSHLHFNNFVYSF